MKPSIKPMQTKSPSINSEFGFWYISSKEKPAEIAQPPCHKAGCWHPVPLSLRLILNHTSGCPSVARCGNNRTGGDWGPIFHATENAAVTLAPLHIHYCCFQLQPLLSQLKLSLAPALLQRAMCCTGSTQLLCLSNQTEKWRGVLRGRQTWQVEGNKWTLPGLAEMPLAAGAAPAQVEGAAPSPACGTLQGAEASACAVQLQPLPASNKPSKQLSTSEHGSVPRNSSGSIQRFKPKTSWHYQVELNHLYSHNHDDPLATSSFLLLALLDSVQQALTQVTAAYGK